MHVVPGPQLYATTHLESYQCLITPDSGFVMCHNALARAICSHRLGRLHDRTAQAQHHRASGLALDTVRRGGNPMPNALLAHLAPLGWQHINLTGDYLWGADTGVDTDGFRPLRGTTNDASLVAKT